MQSAPGSPAPDTDAYRQTVERFSAMADERLERLIAAEEPVPNLHEGLRFTLGLDQEDPRARGKRLRPVLCMATAESLGADPRAALDFACAIELMHNFALVHDDIEDGDEIRRNRPTTWKRFGLAHGVNIGDYLFCKVWSILLSNTDWDDALKLRLMKLMSETLDHTHVGQALDMNARQSKRFTHAEYFRLVREKTGYYLAAPMLGGAMIAGANERSLDALRKFGHHLGPLFQITDDTLDLTRGKGRGGAIGSDLREGKRSFLVAEATARATEAERERLYRILDASRQETADADVEWALDLFERYGVLRTARVHCEELLEKALADLKALPAPCAATLGLFARQMLDRSA